MSTDILEESVGTLPPFAIEIDHHRNGDVLLQSIPGVRLRSVIESSRPIKKKNGDLVTPIEQAVKLASFPRTPGMQVHVDPEKLTYKIVDPLRGDENLCGRIHSYFKKNGLSTTNKVDGLPTVEGTLGKHEIKTLCRELFWLVDAGDAKKASGVMPDMEDIESMPGRFLFDVGARIQNTQPRYQDQWEDWKDALTRSGG